MINRLAFSAVAAVSLTVALAPSATAEEAPRWSRTLTNKVIAPFQLAVSHGTVYVADGGTSTVSKIGANGNLIPVVQGPQPGDVAGLDLNDAGTSLAYTASNYATGARTFTIKTQGRPDVVADLATYEATNNPDGRVTYGLGAGASQCAKEFIEQITGGPATYTGLVDSHPYAVESLGNGTWAVADAGANALFKVDGAGRVSTLSVLPPQAVTFTKAIVNAIGAPNCLVGETYKFEPVPTDVEQGADGRLWVTNLPGGPEDGSLGKRGSVYTVDATTGQSAWVSSGFAGATNVAVSGDGPAFVTELFGGMVTKVTRWGQKSTFEAIPRPLAVEVHQGFVYVATMAKMDDNGTPIGKGVVLKIRRGA